MQQSSFIDWRSDTPPAHYRPGLSRGDKGFITKTDGARFHTDDLRTNHKTLQEAVDHFDELDSIRRRGKISAEDSADSGQPQLSRHRAEFEKHVGEFETVLKAQPLAPADWTVIPAQADRSRAYEADPDRGVRVAHLQASLVRKAVGISDALQNASSTSHPQTGALLNDEDIVAATVGPVADTKTFESLRQRAEDGDPSAFVAWSRALRLEGKITAAETRLLEGCRKLGSLHPDLWLEAVNHANGPRRESEILQEALDAIGDQFSEEPADVDAQRNARVVETLWLRHINLCVIPTKRLAAIRDAVERLPWCEALWERLFAEEEQGGEEGEDITNVLKFAVKQYPQLVNAWLRLIKRQVRPDAKRLLIDAALKSNPTSTPLWILAIHTALDAPLSNAANPAEMATRAIAATLNSDASRGILTWCTFASELAASARSSLELIADTADGKHLPFEVAVHIMRTLFPVPSIPANAPTWLSDVFIYAIRDRYPSALSPELPYPVALGAAIFTDVVPATDIALIAAATMRDVPEEIFDVVWSSSGGGSVAQCMAALCYRLPTIDWEQLVGHGNRIDVLRQIQQGRVEGAMTDSTTQLICATFSTEMNWCADSIAALRPSEVELCCLQLRLLSTADSPQHFASCVARLAARATSELDVDPYLCADVVLHGYARLNEPDKARVLLDTALRRVQKTARAHPREAYERGSSLRWTSVLLESKYATPQQVLRLVVAALKDLRDAHNAAGGGRLSAPHAALLGKHIDVESPIARPHRAKEIVADLVRSPLGESQVPPHVHLAVARVYNAATSKPHQVARELRKALWAAVDHGYGLVEWCSTKHRLESQWPDDLIRVLTATPETQCQFFAGSDEILSRVVRRYHAMPWSRVIQLLDQQGP